MENCSYAEPRILRRTSRALLNAGNTCDLARDFPRRQAESADFYARFTGRYRLPNRSLTRRGSSDKAPDTQKERLMLDIIYLGLGLVLIGVMGIYAHLLTRA